MTTEDRTIEVQTDPDEAFALVPTWVVFAGCTDKALRLYVVLAAHRDATSKQCWQSRATLAKEMGCSTDSVDRAARELQELGAITVQRRFSDDGEPLPNLWTVHRYPPSEGGSRTGAARGSRKAAAGVAAPVRHKQEPDNKKTNGTTADAVDAPAEKKTGSGNAPEKAKRKDRLTPYRDALLEAFGVDPATVVGKRGWGPWNAAAKDLADAGVDPAEIGPMYEALRKRDQWRDRITPVVLVQEWATLVAEATEPVRRANVKAAIAHARQWTLDDDLAEDVVRRLASAGMTHPDEIAAALDAVGLQGVAA